MHLADRLTESLRKSGDLAIAEPDLSYAYVLVLVLDINYLSLFRPLSDADGDQIMLTAANRTQFTQSLLLFVRPYSSD